MRPGTERLVADLTSLDSRVRRRAADALGVRSRSLNPLPGDPGAMEPLLAVADDSDKNVRNAVLRSLWAIAKTAPSREPMERLVRALGDESWRVRFAAASAYGVLIEEPYEPLVPLISDPQESVRWAAAVALCRHGGRWQEVPRDVGSLRALEPALADSAATVRAAAVSGFGALSEREGLAAVRRAMEDRDARVRAHCLQPLAHHGAFKELAALLRGPHPWVAIGAARYLGTARAVAAVPPLIDTLGARNHETRSAAAQALGAIHDERALDPIAALLRRLTTSHIRSVIVTVLGDWGDARALQELERLVDDPDPNVRYRATLAVKRMLRSPGAPGSSRAVDPSR
jgi:HEAT repeat protein